MRTKKFHLGEVLSVTTHHMVSPRGLDGVYDILRFMTGEDIAQHQVPRAMLECQPYLLKQFPQLATPEMDLAVAELKEMIKTRNKEIDAKELVLGWLAKQVAKYGEMFAVKSIPNGAHEYKDPVTELVEMRGDPEKVIGIGTK